MMSSTPPVLLNDRELRVAIQKNILKIYPFSETNIQPNSYDITLNDSFIRFNDSTTAIDPFHKIPDELTTKIITDYFIIKPGEFILAETIETISLPPTICGKIEGKSSIGRLGLNIQNAGFIDAGFSGSLTLELLNTNKYPIILRKGMAIGQVAFTQVNPCETPYNKKKGAKYNNQSGATPSKYYMNNPSAKNNTNIPLIMTQIPYKTILSKDTIRRTTIDISQSLSKTTEEYFMKIAKEYNAKIHRDNLDLSFPRIIANLCFHNEICCPIYPNNGDEIPCPCPSFTEAPIGIRQCKCHIFIEK
ncbi:dCTP deaminase [Bacteroides sp.]|uniref:dCTP deaminase n=1 Tax=Bacteroides sp. TaxID=29523 RepID=UPI00262E61E9|nr:dCTP deaminase [Bacteroides sp.]MDD3041111.1 dCTP deaminase [Bacteroides sp.]